MSVKIVECPRDAMQGWSHPIATATKIDYLKSLLNVGFDVLDCGSFVSAKAIPQLADSKRVIESIAPYKQATQLLCIVANERGAQTAATLEAVDIIGFPFSLSETFQIRNTKQTTQTSIETLQQLLLIGSKHNKTVQVYLSMCFGNPYQDPWSIEMVIEWCHRLKQMGVEKINLSDTIGAAKPQAIETVFKQVHDINGVEFGAHFHTTPFNAIANLQAAYDNGCKKFDAAIKGYGGCPFAADQLTGNLPTETLLTFLQEQSIPLKINQEAFALAMAKSQAVFVES